MLQVLIPDRPDRLYYLKGEVLHTICSNYKKVSYRASQRQSYAQSSK